MNADETDPTTDFRELGEITTDSRWRISLGRMGVKPGTRYKVEGNTNGVLILLPINPEKK